MGINHIAAGKKVRMETAVSESPFLTHIILLTAHFYAEQLGIMLAEYHPQIQVLVIEHPKELLLLPSPVLARSRLISFGSRFYVSGAILDKVGCGSYNFHPGPPSYPGWAPFHFAIYDQAKSYGVTVHEMTAKIDDGAIIAQKSFSVRSHETVQGLMDLTTLNMYILFSELAPHLVKRRMSLPACDLHWNGTLRTKKQFMQLCEITAEIDETEFQRRLRAFGDGDGDHIPFLRSDAGLYKLATGQEPAEQTSLWVHGRRFVLSGPSLTPSSL